MKLQSLAMMSALGLSGCDAGQQANAASQGCTQIVSSVERLACFDALAGTPPSPLQVPSAAAPEAVVADDRTPEIVVLVRGNETDRRSDETASLVKRTADALPGQEKVVISAPALDGALPRTYLAISCLSNISRLQLLTPAPLPVNRVNIRLLLDGRPITSARPWQVLDDGTVIDAGRGLVAIEQLRHLAHPGQVLEIESDHGPFDGLRFDVSVMARQMVQQREACRW